MRSIYFCVIMVVMQVMPIYGIASNSVIRTWDPWGEGEIDPYYKDATLPSADSSESPVFLHGIATNGISPSGSAFIYAWYGDAFRLFGLLDVMRSNGVNVSTLRMGREHESFTVNWESPDFSLLHVAVLRGHTNIVHELISKYGLSPNDKGPKGTIESPLQSLLANRRDRFGLVDVSPEEYTGMALLLIKLGARVGGAELRTAVFSVQNEVLVEAILKSGADPNYYRPENLSPIIQSVEPSSDKILKLLVDYGADLYATNFIGFTIFDIAEVNPKKKAQLKRLGLYPVDKEHTNQVPQAHTVRTTNHGENNRGDRGPASKNGTE